MPLSFSLLSGEAKQKLQYIIYVQQRKMSIIKRCYKWFVW